MNSNVSGITAPLAPPTSEHAPWCVINHADPLFDPDCHIADVDWSAGLGLTLGTADGAPVAVDILWDHSGAESLSWTPDEARQVAAALLRLADIAEQSPPAGVPQFVIQHTASGRCHVVGARDDKPVDGVEYDDFDAAKVVRDRLNERARAVAAMGVQSQARPAVLEAECGHYMVVADGESVDGEHYSDQGAAQAAAEILTAEQLDALPIHAEVTDNKGVEWKKFFGPGFRSEYWAFRCLGGHNHDSKATSERLAQYAPRLLQDGAQ